MPRIVSVHAHRGGVGTTNAVAHLGSMLARRGKRVGMVDICLRAPGLHVLFGIDSTHTVNDFLWSRGRLVDAAIDVGGRMSGLLPSSGQLLLLPASARASEIARIVKEGYGLERLGDGLQRLVEDLDLDLLLIDTPAGVTEEALLATAISDCLLLLLRPDRQDYEGTQLTLELARRLDPPQVLLAVTKALPASDKGAIADGIASTYRTPVAAVLPLCEDLFKLGSGGLLPPTADKPYLHGLRHIAELIESD